MKCEHGGYKLEHMTLVSEEELSSLCEICHHKWYAERVAEEFIRLLEELFPKKEKDHR